MGPLNISKNSWSNRFMFLQNMAHIRKQIKEIKNNKEIKEIKEIYETILCFYKYVVMSGMGNDSY